MSLAIPASHARLRTVGVTGTNGKTSTTWWLAHALARVHAPVPTTTTVGAFLLPGGEVTIEKNWNGFVGLMDRAVSEGATYAAIEMTSEALSRGFAKSWPAEVAVFTNLSHDHLDSHGSPEHYLASKAQLFVHLKEGGTAVLNGCDETSALLREIVPRGVTISTYGDDDRGQVIMPLTVRIASCSLAWEGNTLDLQAPTLGRERLEFHTRAIGRIFGENAVAALLGLVGLGIEFDEAVNLLEQLPAPPGRFEVIAKEPYVVIDYAHTPDALKRTIATARNLPHEKLHLVFGAGGDRDKAKRIPMGEAAKGANTVWLTSDNPRHEAPETIAATIARGLGATEKRIELDRRAAISGAIASAGKNDIVLIAGRGHEQTQIVGEQHLPFSDVRVALEALGME